MQNLSKNSRERSKSIGRMSYSPQQIFDLLNKFCYIYGEIIEIVDAICAIENGGVIPGRMIADIHNKPFYSLTKDNNVNASYGHKNWSTKNGKSIIPAKHKLIALFDDVIDTGKEMERARKKMEEMNKHYFMFTLIIKPWHQMNISKNIYFVESKQEWVKFPWEHGCS